MSIKATRRTMISCYAQIINDYVLGYKIPELVKHEKIKGCAFDAPYYAIYQVQVSGSVQLFALRRIYPSRHVAEKGSYAEPLVLWDSTSPGKRSPTRKCTIFTGV